MKSSCLGSDVLGGRCRVRGGLANGSDLYHCVGRRRERTSHRNGNLSEQKDMLSYVRKVERWTPESMIRTRIFSSRTFFNFRYCMVCTNEKTYSNEVRDRIIVHLKALD